MKQKSKQIKLTLVLTILLSFISEANTIFASGTTNPRDNMFTYLGTSIQGILNFNPFLNTDNQNSLNGVDTSQAGLLPNGQIKGNNQMQDLLGYQILQSKQDLPHARPIKNKQISETSQEQRQSTRPQNQNEKKAQYLQLQKQAQYQSQIAQNQIKYNSVNCTHSSSSPSIIDTPQTILDKQLTSSKISLNASEISFIKNKLFNNKLKSMKLVYRASQNNFTAASFHNKCDGLANTFTLILTSSKYQLKIGGFTPIPWSSNGTFAADPLCKSFVFSLTDNLKLPLYDQRYATFNYKDYGPTFGLGHDIRVADNANRNGISFMNPFNSYKNNSLSSNARNSFQFKGPDYTGILEYEVYQVVLQ